MRIILQAEYRTPLEAMFQELELRTKVNNLHQGCIHLQSFE